MSLSRRQLGAVTAAAIVSTAGLSKPAKAKVRIKHAGAGNDQYRGNIMVKRYYEEVAKRTGGEVEAECFFGTLGGEKTLLDGVGLGTLDSYQGAYTGLAEFDLFYAAYLFRDYDHAAKVINGPLRPKLTKLLEDKYKGLLLGMGRAGPFGLHVKEKINAWTDIKGRKIRSGPIEGVLESLKAFGANAVPIAFNEVYSALQQGVVDGQVTLATLAVTQKYYEVVKYAVRQEFGLGFDKVVISQRTWSRISPAHQKLMLDLFVEWEAKEWYPPMKAELDADFKKWESINGPGSVIDLRPADAQAVMNPVNERMANQVLGAGSWKQIQDTAA